MTSEIDIRQVSKELAAIARRANALEARHTKELGQVHPEFRAGARNLLHYLALRQSDISALQPRLATLGLSSLGQAERNVMGSIAAVCKALHALSAEPLDTIEFPQQVVDAMRDHAAVEHKQAILGPHPEGRDVSIMVTLPTEAAENPDLVAEMIGAGMNIARINCAHDDAPVWEVMIANVKKAAAAAGTDCRILMDLAGPKLRTGPLQTGPRVVRIRPRRGPMGRVTAPRRVRFMPDDLVQRGTKAALIPVPRACIERAEPGDEFRLRDTRGKRRQLTVIDKDAKGLILETDRGTYIATGTELRLKQRTSEEIVKYRVSDLPVVERPLVLRVGDTLIMHRNDKPGAPAKQDDKGKITSPAHVACLQPEVFQFVHPGDPISLNDGKISGVVKSVDVDTMVIDITKAKPAGSNLRANRGINFPGSDIRLPGLTEIDLKNLEFVVRHADAVSLSFVREPDDIALLQEALRRYPDRQLGVVVKIETSRGFENLPWLLLRAMQGYPAAVMIARGDLAVECGWERLAEIQEEILWFCEAAQVPVMWATQVLENTTKKGQPSRAEISDAALAQRADCVMLNKGPYVLAAIRMLDNILRRMQSHQYKKTSRMRKLDVAGAST